MDESYRMGGEIKLDDYRNQKIGEEEESVQIGSFLRRYSTVSDSLERLSDIEGDVEGGEEEECLVNDTIGTATDRMLTPLRNQVANIGVDVAVLDDSIQNLISYTEHANNKISQVTNFVVDLIERLEDIDEKANGLMKKWKEERSIAYEFSENADDVSCRLADCFDIQTEQIDKMNALVSKLESEMCVLGKMKGYSRDAATSTDTVEDYSEGTVRRGANVAGHEKVDRLECMPGETQNKAIKPPIDDKIVENLLVDDPENVDFKAKRNAFFVMAEKRKTNDTFSKFKGTTSTVSSTLSPKPEWKYQTNCTTKETKSQATETDREPLTDTEIQTDSEFERAPTAVKKSDNVAPKEPQQSNKHTPPPSGKHCKVSLLACVMLWLLSILISVYGGIMIAHHNTIKLESQHHPEL